MSRRANLSLSAIFASAVLLMSLVGPVFATPELSDAQEVSDFSSTEPLATAKPREPIHISGDHDLTPSNGVIGGSGSPYDPFIIAGWQIAAPHASGIWIEDTTASVILRNNFIAGAFLAEGFSAGIRIERATDLVIVENQVEASDIGIFVKNSDRITIDSNVIKGIQGPPFTFISSLGIKVWNSAGIRITANTISDEGVGISVQGPVSDIVIRDNEIRDTIFSDSIQLYDGPKNVRILNNTVDGGPGVGIIGASDVTVKGNSISATRNGIFLGDAGPNARTVNITVEDNYFSDARAGIDFDHCADCLVRGNVIRSNERGLVLRGTAETLIENNIIQENDIGVDVMGQEWAMSNNSMIDNPIQVRLWQDFDARWNWWGDANGPRMDQIEHTAGTHELLHDPWLVVPPE